MISVIVSPALGVKSVCFMSLDVLFENVMRFISSGRKLESWDFIVSTSGSSGMVYLTLYFC